MPETLGLSYALRAVRGQAAMPPSAWSVAPYDGDTLCPVWTSCHCIAPVLPALSIPVTLARDMAQQLCLRALSVLAKPWRHVARRLLL